MKFATIEEHHLIGLNTQEAFLLLRLLSSARLHGPTALELELGGDADRLCRQLSTALLRAGCGENKATKIPQGLVPPQKNIFDIG
jgi:hypothetical protein